ncbi:energy transducer TonB [Tenacibaculum jejuense]|uniref:TonB family protein n=1 Tax=Tenacibaculum jejuense TaxID=584609 RepID=A0A238UBB3_9FLAO|nr:energy transducer TonB [Tenacibaculum jejuense]SNR16459.1 TonB family protein precursor [Tenacibaculum jejuense]
MNKKLRFSTLLLLFYIANVSPQSSQTCSNSVDDPVLDLNSITKCSIDRKSDDNKVQKVTVQVTSRRRRVVRKRNKATGLSSANNYSHKLASIKKKVNIVNSLVDIKKDEVPDVLPYDYVDQIPLFKSCESAPIYEQDRCFKVKLRSHIKKNLKYPVSAYDRGIQGRVYAHFSIGKDGVIKDLKIVSPYKGDLLGKEAKRIIKKLPKFKPGEHNGNAVAVKYGLPITFKIPGKKPTNIRKTNKIKSKETIHSFSSLDQIPQFDSCKKTDDDSLTCFNTSLIQHIQSYFAYPEEAKMKNMQGNVIVNFVINKKGNVVDITAKGPENAKILEVAAVRFIEKLPKLKAGKIEGKTVNASYSFPINFTLN